MEIEVSYYQPQMRRQQHGQVDTTTNNYDEQQPTISIADELAKLAKLKEQGVISEEFQQMKQDLLKRS